MLKAIQGAALSAAIFLVPLASHAAERESFGNDIPLEMAVRSIVPQGVTVQMGDGVDAGTKVSWGKETSWKKAVASAASDGGYVAMVTDDEVRLMKPGGAASSSKTASAKDGEVADTKKAASAMAAPRPSAKPKPAARPKSVKSRSASRPAPKPSRKSSRPERTASVDTNQISGSGFVLIPENSKAPRVASTPAKADGWQEYSSKPQAAPAAPQWVALPGDDLYVLLSEWSQKAGWRLVWSSGNRYSLTSAAKFDGDFVGAVTQLLASMRDVRPMVTAKFYTGNTTLVVGNDSLDAVN